MKPRKTNKPLDLFEKELGFCEKCGNRVNTFPKKIVCPKHDKIHHNEVEWMIVKTIGQWPEHISEV